MTTVERIREVCKNKGIPISKLERDCGFSNGYINSLKKGTVMCHMDEIARKIFMGHSQGKANVTNYTYTHVTDEWLKEEMQKYQIC